MRLCHFERKARIRPRSNSCPYASRYHKRPRCFAERGSPVKETGTNNDCWLKQKNVRRAGSLGTARRALFLVAGGCTASRLSQAGSRSVGSWPPAGRDSKFNRPRWGRGLRLWGVLCASWVKWELRRIAEIGEWTVGCGFGPGAGDCTAHSTVPFDRLRVSDSG